MFFEKIKHAICAMSLMAYAVNDTAKVLNPYSLQYQVFLYSFTQKSYYYKIGITNLQKTL